MKSNQNNLEDKLDKKVIEINLVIGKRSKLQDEFNQKMATYTSNLDKLFSEGKSLEDSIKERLGELKYEV